MVPRYDGLTGAELGVWLGVPRVELLESVDSTMDAAHALAAAGAQGGTLVVTDHQRAGRGRQGRRWASVPGASITMTLLGAPCDRRALQVLSLRVGLALASALEALGTRDVFLKWPNDLMQGRSGGKLGGILIETRWHADVAEWVAIGVGLNLAAPGVAEGAFLQMSADRLTVLGATVRAVRAAVAVEGDLSLPELADFARRDWLAGRRVVAPARGVVTGIDASGALAIAGQDGATTHVGGSPVLEEDEYAAGV